MDLTKEEVRQMVADAIEQGVRTALPADTPRDVRKAVLREAWAHVDRRLG